MLSKDIACVDTGVWMCSSRSNVERCAVIGTMIKDDRSNGFDARGRFFVSCFNYALGTKYATFLKRLRFNDQILKERKYLNFQFQWNLKLYVPT